MKFKDYKEEIEIPEGVEVTVSEGNLIYVKGEKGEIKRALRDPKIKISVENNKVIIFVKVLTKNEKTMVGTFKSHIKNMLKGVKEPYVYKLKICSGHFPMNVSYSNNELSVKNFIGEKIPRKLKIQQGVIFHLHSPTRYHKHSPRYGEFAYLV